MRSKVKTRFYNNKRTHDFYRKPLKFMARPGGFEPSAKSLEGSCSVQLSYGREQIHLSFYAFVVKHVFCYKGTFLVLD